MYYENICSLCITTIKKNGSYSLFRIADLENGKFTPFRLNENLDYGGQNVNFIYNPNIREAGKIGIWEWECKSDIRQFSYANNNFKWIEYRQLVFANSLGDVVNTLLSGIENIETDHDYLFTYVSDNRIIGQKNIECLFVRGVDFQIQNNLAILKDKISYLMVYWIDVNDIKTISPKYLTNNLKHYYCYIDLPKPHNKIYIKNKLQIIKELIKAEINKTYVINGTNSDRKAVRNFLDLLPDSPLADSLAKQLNCNLDEAETYVTDFLQCCEKYFACEDYNSEIMKRLIACDVEIAEQFKVMVQENWHKENIALIENADNELKLKQKELEQLQDNIEKLAEQENAKVNKIAELEAACKTMRQTVSDIESEVQKRIIAAQQDIAHFFSEYSMFMPYNANINSNSNTNSNKLKIVDTISDTPQEAVYLLDLFDCLSDNIETIGVDEEKCKALTAYILAAYFIKKPLIIAGYGATLLLDALSATLNNRKAIQIYELKNLDEQELKQLPAESIIGLHNAFDITLINKLVSENTHLYFSIISPTIEELAIEPRGMYSYALPLFAEYFIKSEPVSDLEGCLNSFSYTSKKLITDKTIKKLIPDYLLPEYAKRQCVRLMSIAKEIYNDINIVDMLAIQVLPLMRLLKGIENTHNYIDKLKLTDNEKLYLQQLVGDEI